MNVIDLIRIRTMMNGIVMKFYVYQAQQCTVIYALFHPSTAHTIFALTNTGRCSMTDSMTNTDTS